MHLARIIDEHGKPDYAVADLDGDLTRTHGSLSEGFRSSGQPIEPQAWLPPLDPRAILCIGRNYAAHAAEQDAPPPDYPVVFFKNPAAAIGHLEPIQLPQVCGDEVDYEGELAVIIGKPCCGATVETAWDYVFGYTIANDVSARIWQFEKSGSQWSRAKSFDTFCPLGPYMVTSDAFDPATCRILTELNGNVVQDAPATDMLFDVPHLIAFLSEQTTLLPGTVILTGTPSGIGWARNPRRMLQAGDVVTVTIDGIGTLVNEVVQG
jgi:2-keto-4-pentenoate hydratase/2-oxohepta-3-ene-1,7-dioic acid hydratase in catechol pathway